MSGIAKDISTKKWFLNNTKLLVSAASALDKILFGTNRNTAIASTTSLDVETTTPTAFEVLDSSTFTILGQAVDNILEVTLLNTNLTTTSQNLIKGL